MPLAGLLAKKGGSILSKTVNNQITRREFLKSIGVGVALSGLSGLGIESALAQTKVKVIEAKSDNVWKDGKLDAEVVKNLMGTGMQTLTHRESTADAWKDFFGEEDVVGVKINPLAGLELATHRVVVDQIIAGLKSAGVKENNIIIWDRFEAHLKRVGYELNLSDTGVRYYATNGKGPGYDEKVFYETDEDAPKRREDGNTKSYLSKIVTKQVTKIINVPVLKQHGVSGVSLCLKNIAFGSVNNTARFHPNPINCSPAIGEICSIPAIKEKLVLNILDGLRGCYDGGPGYKPESAWEYNSLIFSVDPVALDKIGMQVIEDKRKEAKLESITSLAKHISKSSRLGLGTDDMDEIDLQKITV